MQLPGGLWHNNQRNRRFSFRPLTGEMELVLAEIAGSDASLPAKVTSALSATLDRVGGEVPTGSLVETLCVADRQFMMRILSVYLGAEEVWLTARCKHCGEQFDFMVNQSELPVKEAGEGFPFAPVETSVGFYRLRVPNGADQLAIATVDNSEAALQTLLERCIMDLPDTLEGLEDSSDFIKKIRAEDLRKIETAVENVAPEVATMAQAACPECKGANIMEIDPYMCLKQGSAGIFTEIHTLASTYHWSETDILSMPKIRRQRYLKLIDRSRGMVD